MTRSKNPSEGFTRRSFLKTAGVTAGLAGLGAGGMFSADSWLKPAAANAQSEEKIAYMYHCVNCGTPGCGMKCTVRDGRLVNMEPNNGWEDDRFKTICLKGISEIDRMYGADRLQTPLKRVGERGAREFMAISWDEAISTMVEKLKETIEKHGAESVCIYSSSSANNSEGAYMQMFPQFLGIPATRGHTAGGGIDCGISNGFSPTIGATAAVVGSSTDVRTWTESKMIVLVGHNPAESRLHSMRFIAEAKEAGAKLVVIDPRYTPTAQKADWWIPIKPGTDSAFFIAAIQYIVENNLYDEEFVKAYTSCPFLVDVESGDQLRQYQETLDADGKAINGEQNPFMVWDNASNSIKAYNDPSVDPDLFREVEIENKTYKTVMSLIKDEYATNTPKWASEITEIPIEEIERFAKEYATCGAAVMPYGMGGTDKYASSDITGHAMSILVSLTGNVGRPGTGFGEGCVPQQQSATMGSWKLPESFKNAPSPKQSAATFTQEKNPIRALVGIGNPLNQMFTNFNHAVEWFKTLDFIAVINTFHCTSVDYADIVLPSTTSFESEYEHRGIQARRDHLLLGQKVVDPLFESHTDFEIERMLCEYLGYGDLVPKTPTELIEAKLEGSGDAYANITIQSLESNECIQRLNVPLAPPVKFKDQKYTTPSTRLEVYHQKMQKHGQALPTYVPSPELMNEGLLKKYPLQYAQVRTRSRVHSQFAESSWITQVNGQPTVRLNPKDADARGLKTGDLVEAVNDRGTAKYYLAVTNDVRPGQALVQEGWWTTQMPGGNTNYQNVTNDSLEDRQRDLQFGPVIPIMDTLVEIRKV